MSYVINKFNGEELVVLENGTIDTSTSLGLVGRNYVGYGETQNENFVFLLENFANDEPPSRPLKGQIWYDTSNGVVNVYDGAKWMVVGSAALSTTPPPEPTVGALWLKTPANTLNVYTSAGWAFIGPETSEGFGITRARSTTVEDSDGNTRPVIFLTIDGQVVAICTNAAFVVDTASSVSGFSNSLNAGINLRSSIVVNGNITGNAESANRFATPRLINGTSFDGQSDVTIKSSTTNKLKKGSYISGSDFDGTTEQTWSVDASSANIIGKVVVRNSEGGFAAGTITANLVGNVTGNVTASSGTSTFDVVQATTFVGATLTGTANAARQLANNPKINDVTFTGLSDVTVPAAAATLTGNTIAANVVNSSLTSVGTLVSLSINDAGTTIGSSGQLKLLVDGTTPTIRSLSGTLNFDIGPSGPDISFVNGSTSLSLGGPNAPAIIGDNTTNLGIAGYKFNGIYANNLYGNADTATLATRATNIVGGGAGAIPYQTAANTTVMLGLGTDGYVLRARPSGPAWEALGSENLTKGSYINFINTTTTNTVSNYNLNVPVTISVDASSTNTASKIVARDASGNFAAGTITAGLVGNVTGNSTTATRLATPRNINGVSFDGTADITVTASDTSKVAKSGDTMTGYLTLNGDPTSALHATPKQYVDSRLPQYTFTYGQVGCVGYTNQVGSFNNGSNYFDVFPPSGKVIANLVAFIPSLNTVHYAGGVDGNDSIRTTYQVQGDRIRVWVQNTEQRSTPAGNYLAIWS